VALLQLRKKSDTPTVEWLQQLPHKARKLEEQLYWAAPTLEAYLDKSTLKNRLRRVAMAITSKFQEVNRSQNASNRTSFSSISTTTTMNSQYSHQTMESLRALREHLTRKASLDQQQQRFSSTGSSAANGPFGGIPTEISTPAPASSKSEPSQQTPLSSVLAGNPRTFLRPSIRASLAMIPESTDAMSLSSATSKPANDQTNRTSTNTNLAAPADSSFFDSTLSNDDFASQLEQQKALNARLQQQIMENIRRQEEMVRILQEGGNKKSSDFDSSGRGGMGNNSERSGSFSLPRQTSGGVGMTPAPALSAGGMPMQSPSMRPQQPLRSSLQLSISSNDSGNSGLFQDNGAGLSMSDNQRMQLQPTQQQILNAFQQQQLQRIRSGGMVNHQRQVSGGLSNSATGLSGMGSQQQQQQLALLQAQSMMGGMNQLSSSGMSNLGMQSASQQHQSLQHTTSPPLTSNNMYSQQQQLRGSINSQSSGLSMSGGMNQMPMLLSTTSAGSVSAGGNGIPQGAPSSSGTGQPGSTSMYRGTSGGYSGAMPQK
jgi:hypothetical protein